MPPRYVSVNNLVSGVGAILKHEQKMLQPIMTRQVNVTKDIRKNLIRHKTGKWDTDRKEIGQATIHKPYEIHTAGKATTFKRSGCLADAVFCHFNMRFLILVTLTAQRTLQSSQIGI